MKLVFASEVEIARDRGGRLASRTNDDYGSFLFTRKGIRLRVIASAGNENVRWEHASVSTPIRCPTWEEMAWVKSLFWEEDEPVVQFHPPKSAYVNYHPFCLHLWKPLDFALVLLPTIAVGPLAETAS